MEVVLDRRLGDDDDEDVEDRHEGADHHEQERPPGHRRDRGGGPRGGGRGATVGRGGAARGAGEGRVVRGHWTSGPVVKQRSTMEPSARAMASRVCPGSISSSTWPLAAATSARRWSRV